MSNRMTAQDWMDYLETIPPDVASNWLKQHGATLEEFKAEYTSEAIYSNEIFEFLGY